MDRAEERYFNATLIITGSDLDPDAVSELLGLTPTQTWRQGEKKRVVHEDGSVQQFNSIHEWGGWKCDVWGDQQNGYLDEEIDHAIGVLSSRANALNTLRADGFSIELNCAECSSGSLNLRLEHELMKKIVELSLPLDITVYRGFA